MEEEPEGRLVESGESASPDTPMEEELEGSRLVESGSGKFASPDTTIEEEPEGRLVGSGKFASPDIAVEGEPEASRLVGSGKTDPSVCDVCALGRVVLVSESAWLIKLSTTESPEADA
ncbi:MAG: hypothetical protein Q9180_005721 [Flavoplaca navasiana]